MTAPVGWVLVDMETPQPPGHRYTSRQEAHDARTDWEAFAQKRGFAAGRYVVCALIPDPS